MRYSDELQVGDLTTRSGRACEILSIEDVRSPSGSLIGYRAAVRYADTGRRGVAKWWPGETVALTRKVGP